jgi:hypothetical protein
MLAQEGDAARQLDRAQKSIEYVLAVVIPALLAAMLYSYYMFEVLFTPLFVITVAFAIGTVVPAYRALKLHYRVWSRNTMPQRLATGLIGTIYISAAAVFGVSLVSSSKGFSPEQPLTFGVLGLFAILLISVMAYNSRYKVRNERTVLKFYSKAPESIMMEIKTACMARQEDFKVTNEGRRTSIVFAKTRLAITIVQQAAQSSEVLMECPDPVSSELCSVIQQSLDQEA